MVAARHEAPSLIRQRILQLLARRTDAAGMLRELDVICLAGPDAAYEALSLIDQHYRLGRINEQCYRSLKSRASDIALGRVKPVPPPAPPPPAAALPAPVARPAPAPSPATGSPPGGEAPLRSLLDALPGRRLPLALALAVVRDIGHAVAALHAQRIAHGEFDISHIVITDAGAAELRLPAAADQPTELDLRQDLQALAMVACELVSGRHPFKGLRPAEARELGLRPARPPGLNRRQWQLLERELLGRHVKRVPEPLSWLDGLVRRGAARRLPSLAEFRSVPVGRRWSWRAGRR